ncbi:uncharacterized protein Z520_02416 [Fonsecaea multimorphosa CBS 102226]|uniref:NAD dependent epimerase/dehydratase n=1 Tax=Fonsecaea multimorphosa CBS 102226 TaxID=1442371 RepID=A0A0D2K871_9EURO|nr:uncharacterized protein Z520_02416 [Fonsecaea multimorphosa CBS 102226]KIY02278.1 hypothetical protein Z520_02416 [Fonsecaea multimorphosa CBS 102226]OAL28926.1 hypothetical protein AYO22_02362 [Fonsecaea multimorphosa]
MGQTASQPEGGKTLKVIGAGLSRTGTTSFGAACSYLLDGPCYHGGTQMLNSPESHIKRWIEIIKHTPVKDEADRKALTEGVKEMLDGYVACTDLPSNAFVEELMEIYPDAKVICTVRDPEKWWNSLAPIVEKGNLTVLSWLLAPLPTLRWFRTYHDALDDGRVGELYFRPGEPKRPTRAMWDRHIEHLKKVVPKEKLFFYDVRDGWEPLCAILGVPVPKDVPFPKLNDAQAMEGFMKKSAQRGMMVWAGLFVSAGAAAFAAARYAKVF